MNSNIEFKPGDSAWSYSLQQWVLLYYTPEYPGRLCADHMGSVIAWTPEGYLHFADSARDLTPFQVLESAVWDTFKPK